MASQLITLTTEIVSSHATATEMTTEQLVQEIQKVYATLQQLESGVAPPLANNETDSGQVPAMDPKKSIQKNQIVCLICAKGGFKTLARHLKQAHDMKPAEYRKQFGLPAGVALAARAYSQERRESALKNGLADKLAKGRTEYQNAQKQKKAPAPPAKTGSAVKTPPKSSTPRKKK